MIYIMIVITATRVNLQGKALLAQVVPRWDHPLQIETPPNLGKHVWQFIPAVNFKSLAVVIGSQNAET